MILLPGLVLVSKKGFKISPCFVRRRFRIPALKGIGEVPCQVDQVVGGCCDLLGSVGDSSGIGKVDGRFVLFDDRFDWLVDVVPRGYDESVIL